jgi:hypothetical protein
MTDDNDGKMATVPVACGGQVRGPKTETFETLSRTIAPGKPGCA